MNDLIVDGNSLFARSWFAAQEQPQPAMRNCVNAVLQLLDTSRTGRLQVPIMRTLFAWDGTSKTDKRREPKPQAYIDTRRWFQEALLALFDTIHGYHPDYEADDVVATAALNSTARQVFVVSGDKDLMQLQGGKVAYYDLNTKSIMSARVICHKFFVKAPFQIPLAQAITGDSGDGIGGIPRWGPKKVQKVFEWVTDKMDFSEVLAVMYREIPKELHEIFNDALDKTLLHNDLEGVPEPAALRFTGESELESFGCGGLAMDYERIARQYESGRTNQRKAALEEMIKGSGLGSRRPTAG